MTHFVCNGWNLEADTLASITSVSNLVEKSKKYLPHACRRNDEDVRPPHCCFHNFFLFSLIILIPER
jgi:hypothetical protein